MHGENPYRAPVVDPEGRRPRRPMGPILSGVVVMIVAAIVLWMIRSTGLIFPVVVAVLAWWAYKFWPRRSAAEVPEARDFLRRMEDGTPGTVPADPPNDEPPDVLGNLRL